MNTSRTKLFDETDPFESLIAEESAADFLRILYEDAHTLYQSCAPAVKELRAPHGTTARSFVRAVFSFIEGGVAVLRARALRSLQGRLRPSQIAVLTESTYDLNEKGEIRPRRNYRATEPLYLMVTKVFEEHLRVDSIVEQGDGAWRALIETRELRNRLTHPKQPQDLDLSRHDVLMAQVALENFRDELVQLLSNIDRALGVAWTTRSPT